MSGVEVIRAAALSGVPHGFLGRRGGVSMGMHAGLNVGIGSDDDPTAVAENRLLATRAVLPGAHLVTAYQVHSADAVTVRVPLSDRPQGDALVTDRPGLALGILTADCAPVLLADVRAGVVGAAHAGWKGALAGVTDATVIAMTALGADLARIVAAIGPAIARASYEVDDAFLHRFAAADPANERFFADGRAGASPLRPGGLCRAPAVAGRGRADRGDGDRHLCRRRPLLQLPPRDASRRAGLWAADRDHRGGVIRRTGSRGSSPGTIPNRQRSLTSRLSLPSPAKAGGPIARRS